MSRKFILFVLSVFMVTAAWATGGAKYSALVVELKNGERISYFLEQIPIVSLEVDSIYIGFKEMGEQGDLNSQRSIISYIVEDVKRFEFGQYEMNAVESVEADNQATIWIKQLDAHSLVIGGTEANERINIYSVDGHLMQGGIPSTQGETTVSLGMLEKGIYIIRLKKNVSFKILKQ